MAVNVNGNITVNWNITDVRTAISGAASPVSSRAFGPRSVAWQIASGIAAGQSDKIWGDQVTITTAQTLSYDLATGGTLTDEFGAAVVFVKLRAIILSANGIAGVANTTTLQLTRPANGVPFLLATTDAVAPISAGGIVVIFDPAAGFTVTAATADLIQVINSAGASAGYEIIFVGTSA